MPTRLYPDTNIVHLLQSTWTPAEFDCRAAAHGVALATGLHVIYELARGFVSGHHVEEIRAACSFLAEIRQVEYLPQLRAMIAAEFDEAMLGVPIITVLEPLNQDATRLELTRLAGGYKEQAVAFIASREAEIGSGSPTIARENQRRLRSVRGLPTFQAFRTRMRSTAPAALMELAELTRVRIRHGSLSRVLERPAEFPILSAWFNAELYLAWIAAHHRSTPARDKMDDFRHLLESARCDGFVTEDAELRKAGLVISPWRPCLSWDDLRARLA